MPKWLILVSVLILASARSAPIWTWTDENGLVHYSDRPVPGARQIELAAPQTIPSTTVPRPRPAARSTATTRTVRYESVAITSPVSGETLWNIGGRLAVTIAVAPPLAPEHRIDVELDGRRLGLETSQLEVTVPDVFRGTHSLAAIVLDGTGRELARSAPVSFVVQQTSVQNPNSLPARRNNAARRGN